VGEFTITNASGPHHTDVSVLSKDSTESLSITMNSYKHCHHSPTVLHIAAQDGLFCPVATYQKYIEVRCVSKGPLLIFPNNTPVTRSFFINQFKIFLRWCKLDPKFYRGHSFRLGGATTAAENGMSETQIEDIGRWHSKYIILFQRCCRITYPFHGWILAN